MDIARGLRLRREEVGLTHGELAAAIGAEATEIRRYESDEAIPSLPRAAMLAWALDVSVMDFAHPGRRRSGLSGLWWACWQTFRDGNEVIEPHQVKLDQRGDEVSIVAGGGRSPAFGLGDARWRGSLCLWEMKALTGWYLTEGAVRARGAIYFDFDESDGCMTGRWVGPGVAGAITSGLGTMARDEGASMSLMNRLRRETVDLGT
jgi:transcriptional regulator with XRE-family HTH domain